ncbi:polynucleotide kinase 3' phosphatase [Moesziomyces antarcticus T-34]|uniref:Polynucleotide kinase 3' phosphatase n=1 Tax=Pseudozyma antarctica (strain T-34) TaxID=1151754 RepID=M9LYR8_PSEA3|nr:polynucleotide kinase 3' phosphatase [Moesziomyces antarcticus T-34]
MHPTPVLAATPAAEPLQPPRNDAPREQYMLVLSGLIGSGKSTFARALVEHFGDWRRCNQDELGDRHAVVYAARTALLAGHNVVIDRTNIDAKQRRTWLELARELNASTADGERTRSVVTISLTLTISIDEAERRLKLRVGHETIRTPEQALGILPHFLRTYQKATSEEGFHYELTWPATRMSQNPTRDEVNAMLFDRLSAKERGDGVLPERPPPRAGRKGEGEGGGGGDEARLDRLGVHRRFIRPTSLNTACWSQYSRSLDSTTRTLRPRSLRPQLRLQYHRHPCLVYRHSDINRRLERQAA